ncbi:uncharacterized protein B0I36DRAFT_33927 [Microdochium trichocladiopsis]|uniref:Uncharacterized protein n=1 Tax=Microdochium trichocladiopsis TaxID=1682393 RepID=A0A9P8XZ14_9PEZI|nr:uncharacterized protein B0I36DRAFT_33927 [Microdochium trichocladiopsis]KAH7021630.1 hypothetical protein B0I36DRAFT_33927 [Microdochium trichocladiopsis]
MWTPLFLSINVYGFGQLAPRAWKRGSSPAEAQSQSLPNVGYLTSPSLSFFGTRLARLYWGSSATSTDTTFEPSPPDSIAGANDKERKHGTSCEDGNPDEEDDFGEGNDLGEEDKLGEKGDLQEGQAYKIVCARLKPSVVDGRYPRANSGQLQLLPRPVLRLGGKGKLEDEDNLGGEDQPDEDNLGEEHLPDEGPPQCEDGDFVLV